MSHYSVEELIARWKKEELTVEQMLQILREQERRLRELARQPPGAEQTSSQPRRDR